MEDGNLYVWGSNSYGQLASVSYVGASTYVPFMVGLDRRNRFVFPGARGVVAGAHHTVVYADRDLWVFGLNRWVCMWVCACCLCVRVSVCCMCLYVCVFVCVHIALSCGKRLVGVWFE
jgi:hypothetical protein